VTVVRWLAGAVLLDGPPGFRNQAGTDA
jgi:hypothetical protein